MPPFPCKNADGQISAPQISVVMSVYNGAAYLEGPSHPATNLRQLQAIVSVTPPPMPPRKSWENLTIAESG
jgi:hypothetical protein